ncbi:uncharacterized protein G2W53_032240 [Senna tora]|uniref:Uncharacterized protein n=1 Tax=Senna tora TaxID=362788 RepID=A0A834WBL9_9FABA|nr:uncharacterized protein G2W53_032240 [Senna tora]
MTARVLVIFLFLLFLGKRQNRTPVFRKRKRDQAVTVNDVVKWGVGAARRFTFK